MDTTTIEIEVPLAIAAKLRDSHDQGIGGATQAALKLWLAISGEYHDKIAAEAEYERIGFNTALKRMIDLYKLRNKARLAREARSERDARILEMAATGLVRAEIARRENLSVIRVNQIVAKHRANNPDFLPVRTTQKDAGNT